LLIKTGGGLTYQANRPAAIARAEGEGMYRPVRLSAGLGARSVTEATVVALAMMRTPMIFLEAVTPCLTLRLPKSVQIRIDRCAPNSATSVATLRCNEDRQALRIRLYSEFDHTEVRAHFRIRQPVAWRNGRDRLQESA